MLRTIVLAFHHQAGRQVRNTYRRVRLVDVLTSGARGAEGVDADFGGVDGDVGNRISLGKHRDGTRRSVNAPLGFGLGHALHTMSTGLELELGIHVLSGDAGDHFLVTSHVAQTLGDELDLPFVAFGKAHVHAKQVAGK